MKDSEKPMTFAEAAKDILTESGKTAEQIVAQLLSENKVLHDQVMHQAQVKKLRPLLSNEEKAAVLKGCVLEGARILHQGFHATGAGSEIKTTVRFGDGDYHISFRKTIINPTQIMN
jgi:hypothetical protein